MSRAGLPDGERPTPLQLSVAVLLGLVFGALGDGFARVLGLSLLAVIALGVWRAVTLLAAITDHLGPDALVEYPASAETVRIRR